MAHKKLHPPAKEIRTEILIRATPAKIWAILTHFDDYQHWNPLIKFIRGPVAVGNKIVVRLEPPGKKGMTFKPKVLAFDSGKSFRWLGHLLFPGLFDGEHLFELVENEDGTTLFIQSEGFNGILVPLFKKMLDNNTTEGFKIMNQRLKEMAEKP
jgi:hypothetical protein